MVKNLAICNARLLFIKTGKLNSNILDKEISHSWTRSKIYNISFEELKETEDKKNVNLLSINKSDSKYIKFLRKFNSSYSKIYLINTDGSIIFESGNFNTFPKISKLNEENIGTNAVAMSLINNVDSIVYGCEHYNEKLINYVSEGLLIHNDNDSISAIVGIFTPVSDYDKHLNLVKNIRDEIERNKSDVKSKIIIEKEEIKPVNTIKNDKISLKKEENIDYTINDNGSNSNECKVFTLSIIEKQTIIESLNYFTWNIKKSSESLGISRSTLYRKMKEYNIKK